MKIASVECVTLHVQNCCLDLWWLSACADDSRCSLCRSSFLVLLSCSLAVVGACGR